LTSHLQKDYDFVVKKICAGLSVAAILVSAFLAGLAVIPHVHERDLDHSQHKSCPVYQKSFHSADGIVDPVPLFFAIPLCAGFVFLSSKPRLHRGRFSVSSRAPPRLF